MDPFKDNIDVLFSTFRELLPTYQDLSIKLKKLKFFFNENHIIGIASSGIVVLINILTKSSKHMKLSQGGLKEIILYSSDTLALIQEKSEIHIIDTSNLMLIRSIKFNEKYGNIEKILISSDEKHFFCSCASGVFLKVELSEDNSIIDSLNNIEIIDFAVSQENLYIGLHNHLCLYSQHLEKIYQRRIEINRPYRITPSGTSKYFSLSSKYLFKVCFKSKLERISRITEESEILLISFTDKDEYVIMFLSNSRIYIRSCPFSILLIRIPIEAKICTSIQVSHNLSKIHLLANKKLITMKFPKTSSLNTYKNYSEHNLSFSTLFKTKQKVSFQVGSPDIKITFTQTKKSYFLSGHEDLVNCAITINESVCASGSNDYDIRLWDYNEKMCIGILKGHIAPVVCLDLYKTWLLSASLDQTVKIWNWEEGILFHTINLDNKITGMISWKDVLFVAVPEKLYLWDLKNYSLIAFKKLAYPAECLELENEGKQLLINRSKKIFIKNPMWRNDVLVWGNGGGYLFMKQVYDILNGFRPKYDSHLNSFVVFPYKYNILHFYAYFGMSEHLQLALTDGCALIASLKKENPLNLAISQKQFEACSTILKYSNNANFYPFQFKILTYENIIEINKSHVAELENLYKVIWLEFLTVFPKYSSQSDKFPKVYHSKKPTISPLNFFKETPKDLGLEISYFSCINKLPLSCGTSASIQFLESLPKENKLIYKCEIIQNLLLYKWSICKWIMIIEGSIYFIYIGQLTASIILLKNHESLITANVLSGITSFLMLLKIILTMRLTGWNIVDIFRKLLLILYTIENFTENKFDIELILILVVFLSFIQGLYFFSLFSSTRLLTKVVLSNFFKVTDFFILMFYLMFSLFFILNLSGFVVESEDVFILNDFRLALLTLLIFGLVLGLASYKYSFSKDLIEINYTLIELEKILFWNRRKVNYKYFQLCQQSTHEKRKPLSRTMKYFEKCIEGFPNVKKSLENIEKRLDNIQEMAAYINNKEC